jgi:hypothetical protein
VITPSVRALVRKRDDGLYDLEAYDQSGVLHTTLHHALLAALSSEPRYVHSWRPVSHEQRRAGAFGPDVLYVVPE